MIKLTVNASKKYDVIMDHGALTKAGEYIGNAEARKLCIITDSNVDVLYGQKDHSLWTSLESAGFDVYKYVFPGGENHKNMTTITNILEYLAQNNFTRSDMLLALGGGITGDVTGFAAATYLRGVDFIQVPTTLLAVVDSSVGGKTGVNLGEGKNLAGAFHQPNLVIFDPEVLDTLSDNHKLEGIAEAIKAGFIGDPDILSVSYHCYNTDDNDFLTKLAAMAVEVKRRIVEEDEWENGKRALLNLGHTAAHAIEKCSDYAISHGHAVAMGMLITAAAAHRLGWCDISIYEAMLQCLEKFNFSLACPYSADELTSAALHDKKRRGEDITLVIPETIANCVLKKIPVDKLKEFFSAGLETSK